MSDPTTNQHLQLAARIAQALGETEPAVIEKIQGIVAAAGPQRSAQFFKAAAEMYQAGAMTDDGSRRRTKGGCFLYVAKGKMKKEHRLKVGLLTAAEQKKLQQVTADDSN